MAPVSFSSKQPIPAPLGLLAELPSGYNFLSKISSTISLLFNSNRSWIVLNGIVHITAINV